MYPTEKHARFILENSFIKEMYPDMTEEKLKSHLLSLNLYYDSLVYTEISESPQYTASDLISSIGGSLGVCLGASILSLLELLELFTRFMCTVL